MPFQVLKVNGFGSGPGPQPPGNTSQFGCSRLRSFRVSEFGTFSVLDWRILSGQDVGPVGAILARIRIFWDLDLESRQQKTPTRN